MSIVSMSRQVIAARSDISLCVPGERGHEVALSDRCSDDGDSESSYFLVPIPDCFNTDLPPSRNSSTSLIVRKEDANVCSRMQSFDFAGWLIQFIVYSMCTC